MEFDNENINDDNLDETEHEYKKNYTCRCEECGYVWVEEISENNSLFDIEEEKEYSCPICGGSYLNQM